MPFSLGPAEMVFIMVVLLLIFGAKRLPELGSGLGKGIREFRRSMHDIKGELDRDETANQIKPPAPAPRTTQAVPPAQDTGSYETTENFNKS